MAMVVFFFTALLQQKNGPKYVIITCLLALSLEFPSPPPHHIPAHIRATTMQWREIN